MEWIDRGLRAWLVWWFGIGEPHQYQFYRCEGCRGLVTHPMIRRGGCRCGLSIRLRPALLTRGEKARCLFLPWSIAQ